MMNFKALRSAAMFGLFVAPLASASDDPGKDYAIQLFLQACVSSYSHAAQVAAEARKMDLSEVKGDAAARYLNGQSGRVWYGENDSGVFAVSLLGNGLCTVFVHEGDGARIRAGFESWLPPSGSGISVSKENIQSPPGVVTTAFTMRGGKVNEQWILTVASAPEAPLRAIMSYAPQ